MHLCLARGVAIQRRKTEDELIVPAAQGTLRALRASAKAGVKRAVVTSSTFAIQGNRKTGTFHPGDWTNVDAPDASTCMKGKTRAEKAVWDFVAGLSGPARIELVIINPGGIWGPPLERDLTRASMSMLVTILKGNMPMFPNARFPMVDVRDVVTLHVKAMAHPKAAGKRIIAAHEAGTHFAEIMQFLEDARYNGAPTRRATTFLMRFMGNFDREARGLRPFWDTNLIADASETRTLFDWNPIPVKQSFLETASKLQAVLDAGENRVANRVVSR